MADAGAPVEAEAPDAVVGRSPSRIALGRLVHDRSAIVSASVIVLIVLSRSSRRRSRRSPGHGVNDQYPMTGLTPEGLPRPPSSTFLLGTDDLGRDLMVRIAYGTRISLLVGVVATLITVAIGSVVGMVAGFFGGITDSILARGIDVMLSIPFLLFAISLASIVSVTPLHIGPFTLKQGVPIVVLVIGIFSWATVARIVRGQVIAIRHREYVEAARAVGAPTRRIILREILPNVAPTIIVYATLLIPVSIVAEAALSYLGVGVPPPTADWGSMIAEAQSYYQVAWWFLAFPCIALVITTLSFNIFGDCVRDALDPRAAGYRQLMLRFLARRTLQGLVVIWLVTVIVFLIFYVGPGSADVARALAGRTASPETVALISHRLLLDRPGVRAVLALLHPAAAGEPRLRLLPRPVRRRDHQAGVPDHVLAADRGCAALAHPRHRERRVLGDEAAIAARPGLHGDRALLLLDPDVRARAAARAAPLLRADDPRVRVVPAVGLRAVHAGPAAVGAEPHPPVDHAGARHRRCLHPPLTHLDARGDERGLPPDGAREGAEGAQDRLPARAQGRLDAARDAVRDRRRAR